MARGAQLSEVAAEAAEVKRKEEEKVKAATKA